MALTNYLLHSVAFVLLFDSYGLGLGLLPDGQPLAKFFNWLTGALTVLAICALGFPDSRARRTASWRNSRG